jgi:hypothetical protein
MAQLNRRTRKLQGLILWIASALSGAVLLVLADFFLGSEDAVAAVCGTVLLWGYCLFVVAGALAPRMYLSRFAIVLFSGQALWLGLLALLGHSLSPKLMYFNVSVADRPIQAVLPLMVVPLVATISIWIVRGARPLRGDAKRPLLDPKRSGDTKRRFYLIVGAIPVGAYWVAAQPGTGFVGYVGRVAGSAMMFYPLFAGAYSRDDRMAGWIWRGVLAVNVFIGVLIGTRTPFITAVLYSLGWLYTTPRSQRMAAAAFVAGLIASLMFMSGIVGLVRTEMGRGGIEMVSVERAQALAAASRERIGDDGDGGRGEIAEEAFSRLVAWSNLVVPLLSPYPVPYRGYASVFDEITTAATINALAGRTAEQWLTAGMGTIAATQYGFMVNSSTSVEFSVLADGWSRAGLEGALLFGFIVLLLFNGMEVCLAWVRPRVPESGTVLLAVLARAMLDVSTVTVVASIRRAVLDMGISIVLVIVAEVLGRVVTRHSAGRVGTKGGMGRMPKGSGFEREGLSRCWDAGKQDSRVEDGQARRG